MSRDEILAMKPGRELDALVVEKVMGWDIHSKWIGKFNPDYDMECSYVIDEPPVDCPEELKGVTGQIITRRVPDFSTNIEDVWEVVEKLDSIKIEKWDNNLWAVEVCNPKCHRVTAQTAPEAICKAALLALEGGEGE